jgi:hypothetical protein
MMNERIKELELEAIAYADSKVPANNRYNDIYHAIVRGKFAELIIKECMAMCDEVHRDYGMASDTARISKSYIKKHFGVEEK